MSPSERAGINPNASAATDRGNGHEAMSPGDRSRTTLRRSGMGADAGIGPVATGTARKPTGSSSSQVARRGDVIVPGPARSRTPPPPSPRPMPAADAAAPAAPVVPDEDQRDDETTQPAAVVDSSPEVQSPEITSPDEQPVGLVPTEPTERAPAFVNRAPLVTPPEWSDWSQRAAEPPPAAPRMTTHTVAPVPRVMGRRPRVRKVTRVVRHVDPWTVFKVAGVFSLVVYVVTLTAGVLLWNVAYATGTIDNLERFFESFGWSEFEFNGGEIFHNAWIAGLFGAVGLTGAAVLAATLFNLITDLVGGVRFTVLEEEVVERTTAPMRRFVVRRPTGEHALGTDLDVVRPPGPPDAPSR